MANKQNILKGPLTGINVIDFGHYYAGPMVSMMLADQGASVIHVVKPGSLEINNPETRLLSRNKKILELDLKSERGKDTAINLITNADVLVENFRPNVMESLGLCYSKIRKLNSRIIYLSLPGFSSLDTKRAKIQAWEGVISAASGVYRNASAVRETLGLPPVFTSLPLSSVFAALNGVVAVTACLIDREKNGMKGNLLEIPLFNSVLFAFAPNFYTKSFPNKFTGVSIKGDEHFLGDESFKGESEDSILESLSKKEDDLIHSSPSCSIYDCKDGRKIYLWTYNNINFNERLYRSLGIYEEVLSIGIVNGGPWLKGLDNNLGVPTHMDPNKKRVIKKLIANKLKGNDAEYWEGVFFKNHVPAGIVRTREEWLSLPPLQSSGVFVKMFNGESELTTPGRLVDVSDANNNFGEGYEEGKFVSEIEALKLFERQSDSSENQIVKNGMMSSKGTLLKGFRVLDMGNVAAGPIAGQILAQYGADVIKLDHKDSYLDRNAIQYVPALLDGKKSIIIDIKTLDGRRVFNDLVSSSDVVIHNILDETAERLGVSHQQLQDINSQIVSAQISAFGGSFRGQNGWEDIPSFDPVLQGTSGLLTNFGSAKHPLHFAGVACGDITGGFALAFSAMLGLYQKQRTGFAGECRTSLARSITFSQLPYMIAENGKYLARGSHGQFALGSSWRYRMYQCADGWIFVCVPESKEREIKSLVGPSKPDFNEAFEDYFICRNVELCTSEMSKLGIASHRVQSVDEIYEVAKTREVNNEESEEHVTSENELILRWKAHPCGYPVTMLAPSWVRVGIDRSWKRIFPAHSLGEDTNNILNDLGYSKEEIQKFIKIKAVYNTFPPLDECESNYFFDSGA